MKRSDRINAARQNLGQFDQDLTSNKPKQVCLTGLGSAVLNKNCWKIWAPFLGIEKIFFGLLLRTCFVPRCKLWRRLLLLGLFNVSGTWDRVFGPKLALIFAFGPKGRKTLIKWIFVKFWYFWPKPRPLRHRRHFLGQNSLKQLCSKCPSFQDIGCPNFWKIIKSDSFY